MKHFNLFSVLALVTFAMSIKVESDDVNENNESQDNIVQSTEQNDELQENDSDISDVLEAQKKFLITNKPISVEEFKSRIREIRAEFENLEQENDSDPSPITKHTAIYDAFEKLLSDLTTILTPEQEFWDLLYETDRLEAQNNYTTDTSNNVEELKTEIENLGRELGEEFLTSQGRS